MNLTAQLIRTSLFLLLILFSGACGDKKKESNKSFHVPESVQGRDELRFQQYAVQGRLLYIQHCSNCHQMDGTGLAQLIPPLAKADFLNQNPRKVLCIIRWGHEGSIVVNELEYNQPMPANPQLKDIEIAEIATYIFNAWGNKGEFIPVKKAQDWLNDCEQAN